MAVSSNESDKHSESLKEFLKSNDITDYSIIDKETSPRHYRVFEETYRRLMNLIPADEKADLVKPQLIAFKSEMENAQFGLRSLREDGVIAITQHAYENASEKQLAFILSHELGHWLSQKPDLVKKLGGFHEPAVQPLLQKMKRRIEAFYSDKDYAAQQYMKACRELVFDGLAVRITCDPAAGISEIRKASENNDAIVIPSILGGYDFKPEKRDSLAGAIMRIQEKVRNDGIADHPSDDIREEYMRLVAKAFGCALPGKSR